MSEKTAPIAIVGFSSVSSLLEPVWPSTHRALLPVAGKSLICHLMDLLQKLGIEHLRIAGSIQQYAVSKRLGSGEEWGITIRYSDLHGPDLLMQTLIEKKQCYYFVGDQLHTTDADFSNSFEPNQSTDTNRSRLDAAYWKMSNGRLVQYGMPSLTNSNYEIFPLTSVAEYQQVNTMASSGLLNGIHLPGKSVTENVSIDWDTTVSKTALIGPRVFIGKHCKLGPQVTLRSDCTIGNGVVLSKNVRLENVTILPNCFIGSGMNLKDAVITPSGIFDLQGRFYPIEDPTVLGRSRSNEEDLTGLPCHSFSRIESRIREKQDLAPPDDSRRLAGNLTKTEEPDAIAQSN